MKMRLKTFRKQLETLDIQIGDHLTLGIRGIYGNYIHQGKLVHIEDDCRVHLDNGKSHSYKKIVSIRKK